MSNIAIGRDSAVAQIKTHAVRAASLSRVWPLCAIAVVLYGSLIPFTFDWEAFGTLPGLGVLALRFRGASIEDIITNIVVYVPIGLTLVLAGNRGRSGGLSRWWAAVLIGSVVSLLAETLQFGIAIRVSSLTDVLLNVAGAAFGASVGVASRGIIGSTLERLQRNVMVEPSATLAKLLTVGLLLFSLAPFDFVSSTSGLHGALVRVRLNPIGTHDVAFGQPPFGFLAGESAMAVWFAVLGYLFAVARRMNRNHPGAVWVSAVRHGFLLAVLIELLQLFTHSHSLDVAPILLRSLAAMFGAWIALLALPTLHRTSTTRNNRLRIPTAVLLVLGSLQVAALVLSTLDTNSLSMDAFSLSAIAWLPFESMWHRPMTSAAAQMIETLATFGTLAVTCAIVLRRLRVAHVWGMTCLMVTFVAFIAEALQCCTPTQSADTTGPVLALFAVAGAAQVYSLLLPVPATATA